jgi:cell division transport system permease protein
MRANFVVSEAATGLWRNVTMTVAMILTTAVSLALLGAGGLLYVQVSKAKELLYSKVEVSIFLNDSITADQRDAIASQLKNDSLVKSVVFETQDEAYRRFGELFKDTPDLVQNVKPEALPESFRVKLYDPTRSNELDRRYNHEAGVYRVSTQQELVGKLFNTVDAVKNMAFVISLIQGIAALLLIGNTIQFAAYSRRRELSIMRLVGASNWYVHLPFILEAVAAGLIGAGIAWVILCLSKLILVDGALAPIFDIGLVPMIQWQEVLLAGPLLGLVSVALAAVTGWVTLRFYVKV